MFFLLATLLTVYIQTAQVSAPQSGTVTVTTQPGRPERNPLPQGADFFQRTMSGDDLMALPETTTITVE